ncbi:MAG: sigma factor G inhibitor Gin [Bacteroidota bacterium]
MPTGETEPCFCCGGQKREGLVIAGHFLCLDCERLILEMQPGSDGYEELIEGCRALWAKTVR